MYLMRHLHHGDARFLEAFMDHSIAHASPVNAVVVLSRADEIGAARPDALESAVAIAGRYAADPRVRELASGVLPVAGLLAETGATLRQEQYDWLRALAKLDEVDRDHLLTSVERFRDAERNPLGEEIREDLWRASACSGSGWRCDSSPRARYAAPPSCPARCWSGPASGRAARPERGVR